MKNRLLLFFIIIIYYYFSFARLILFDMITRIIKQWRIWSAKSQNSCPTRDLV